MKQMDLIQRKELYSAAIRKNGKDNQLNMVTEEAGELLQALNKMRREEKAPKDLFGKSSALASEVADMEIMLEQLRHIYNLDSRADQAKEDKIKRLGQRVGVVGTDEPKKAQDIWKEFHDQVREVTSEINNGNPFVPIKYIIKFSPSAPDDYESMSLEQLTKELEFIATKIQNTKFESVYDLKEFNRLSKTLEEVKRNAIIKAKDRKEKSSKIQPYDLPKLSDCIKDWGQMDKDFSKNNILDLNCINSVRNGSVESYYKLISELEKQRASLEAIKKENEGLGKTISNLMKSKKSSWKFGKWVLTKTQK